ncbi:unnamed protein product [Arctia plantaginis]|uniref:Uncharacterized protein n=1 Tax=Arctia plantaginis TaxID=874455 RepID=A0A8S1AIM4_ARCPL|nr:unnamed protein product [Arctia plantaginis]
MLPPKHPRPVKCYLKCRYKCTDTFEETDRIQICEFYWRISNFTLQKQYLLSKIIPIPIKRIKVGIPENKHRKFNYGYHFEKDGVQHRVCKDFFLKTLCISNGPVNEALKHKDQHGNYIGQDKRGCQTPINKISPEAEQRIVEHINSFPRLESHYCRKKSRRQYLDCKLSIAKMYELYKNSLESEGETPCSLFVYKRIFGTKYNLSFFKPKKDLCIICTRYESSGRLENLKEEYDDHIFRKNECQAAKQADKERSINDSTYLVVTADMQSTLQIPVSDVGVLYYTRKLNVQNYTIYTAKPPNDAYCILWNEINGKRGSVEIATAIDWVTQIPSTIKEITIYSDTCAGQNRNQFIAAYLLHLVQRADNNLEVFEQKYLESGHTHMEVDSMHSAIEKEQRHSAVYSMIDWKSIMIRARSKRQRNSAPPYNVHELHHQDMLDVRAINEAFIKNINKDKNGDKVMWLKIKCLRFDRKHPGIIQFRYSHEGPYLELDALSQEDLQIRTRKRNKTTQELNANSDGTNRDVLVTHLKEFTIPRNPIYQWIRDHRLHHKFSDTNADPHNANRGFFFSHIGWLMTVKNEEVIKEGKKIDMSDIENDEIIMFFNRNSTILNLIFCFVIPTLTGILLWKEDWKCAVAWQCFIRFLLVFHGELTVNSLAHIHGYTPYNKKIIPKQNKLVSTITFGEGWHNYHHMFPFDYKAAEFIDMLSFSTSLIKWFEKKGWAYDLKEASPEMVISVVNRLGDGISRTEN